MAEALARPGAATGWLIGGEWRAHPARLVAAALAIAVGVALGFAVHLVNRAALDSFARAISTVSGSADLQVHATSPAGVDEALYPVLARMAGVAAVSPVVELTARMVGEGNGPGPRVTLLGIDVLRAARVTPALVGVSLGQPGEGPRLDADAIFLSRAALAASGRRPGDRLVLAAAGRSHGFRIAGVLAGAGEDQALAVIDIADAQWRFGQLGRLHRFDLTLADGTDPTAMARRLAAALPADAHLVSAEDEASRSASLSRAYRVNLGMLAMVALLTGGFLVFSAQSLSVARRTSQFALLRVLGQRRGGLRRLLLIEGLLLGGIGSVIGLVMGHGLAVLVLRLLGGDLGGGYFQAGRAALVPSPAAALVYAGLGVAVAVIASLVPAEAAARAQPAVALKAGGESGDPRRRWPAWPGLALLGAGALAALAPPLFGLPLLGYGAMALLLAGGVAIMPWLARLLLTPLVGQQWPVPVDLAIKRLWGAPSAAAVALSGIVASTSLMVAMAVMVESFRGSVDEWLVQLLPADVYLHVEGAEAGGLDRVVQARLAAIPGVESVRFVRQMPLRVAADRPPVVLSGQPIRADPAGSLPLIGRSHAVPEGATPAWVSEPMAWIGGLAPGDTLELPLGGVRRPFFVAGVWRDYARQFGAVAIDSADFEALTGDTSKSEAAFMLRPGQAAAPVMAAVRAALPPAIAAQTMLAEPRVMRAQAMAIFDRSFAVTYALEVIAILIGLIGVATAFSAQTLARVREFGMLRHIGVRRGQIIAMLASEGAALGGLGVVAGIGLGLLMAQVLIHVINPQSFHWTMDTALPWGLFAGLAAAIIVAAAGTAVLAGRRALSASAVMAVRADW
ncbi:FtsX-like permease family protein [Polymorphobacter sp.]|uniref:FtsX-like permease family protein n=1 Tax=Polymorphobacter sp. TaxID=1909290 RepID=UPI003F6E611C